MEPARKKLRQAAETSDGSGGTQVSVLCFSCRRSADKSVQRGIAGFFTKAAPPSSSAAPPSSSAATPSSDAATPLLCSKCRCVMEKRVADRTGGTGGGGAGKANVLPHIARMRQYQRVAADQKVPWAIAEHAAAALMREPCIACGVAAPLEGHGLTRMRLWPEGLTRPERGGFMGPFHPANLSPCCSMCNLMKGFRSVRGFVEACRHIATHRGGGRDFGRYPRRFRNNTSRRSRSSYISASSTHTKTHALSNEAFARIVARPCRYCGKESDPPRHHNGLDRIDSAVRVYTEASCDSCCGDCNVMKYTWSETDFLACCVRVAEFNVGRDEFPGDSADRLWAEEEEDEQEREQPEPEQGQRAVARPEAACDGDSTADDDDDDDQPADEFEYGAPGSPPAHAAPSTNAFSGFAFAGGAPRRR